MWRRFDLKPAAFGREPGRTTRWAVPKEPSLVAEGHPCVPVEWTRGLENWSTKSEDGCVRDLGMPANAVDVAVAGRSNEEQKGNPP